jgi:methylglyoxal synthase
MVAIRNIALVAHDNCKQNLVEWVNWNRETLLGHQLICTGTTGRIVEEALVGKSAESGGELDVIKLKPGPLGGDQQLGAMIAEGKIDMLIFLWDPMEAHPHDVDVKALLRVSVLYNILTAYNRSTADFLISSHLMGELIKPIRKEYAENLGREITDNLAPLKA